MDSSHVPTVVGWPRHPVHLSGCPVFYSRSLLFPHCLLFLHGVRGILVQPTARDVGDMACLVVSGPTRFPTVCLLSPVCISIHIPLLCLWRVFGRTVVCVAQLDITA